MTFLSVFTGIGGMDKGLEDAGRLVRLANRNALKAAGNIVVPQVAEMIGMAIKEVFEEKP